MPKGRDGRMATGEGMEGKKIRILLVEDSLVDAAVTRRVLKHNHQTDLILAANCKEALALLQSKSRSDLPQLILLDLNLPDISGIELLRRIKKDEKLHEIPVVILTMSNEDQDIQKSYDLGASSYLVKPISDEALMLVIKKLFSS
jgi:CheY-like chemotaxis protein